MSERMVNPELLVEDLSIYPRHKIDQVNINNIALAIKAGERVLEEHPPVVDRKSMRIVDGFHRVRAAIKCGLEEIPVEFRSYRSKAKMIEDAVEANASHGRKLDQRDRVRAILLLEQVGVSQKRIAGALHVPEDRVVKLRHRVVDSPDGPIPDKAAYRVQPDETPMKVTRSQVELIEAAPAWRHLQSIHHITNDLNAGLVNLDDERVVEALGELREAIDGAI